jgi:ribonuclease-3
MLNNIIDRIRLPFRKEKELFSSLYQIIGFYPHHIAYYQQALMHKSVARRNAKGKPMNNERLEFLGDAILDAVVGDIVYRHFDGKREGFLTNTRSKIVQRDTLNKLAQEMGINQLILSSGHSSSHNSYVGGNAFEALVGAIYLDQGYNACMRFMEKRILNQLINIDKVAYKEVNFKSKLIEWSQKNRVELEFKLLEQKKDEKGSPVFSYQVIIEGLEGEKGSGYSKKESQQLASKLTLESLRKKPQFIDAVFAAKGSRTKMEEEPVETVPNTEVKDDFIIVHEVSESPEAVTLPQQPAVGEEPAPKDEFDLSDITAEPKEMTREDIIAAAEAAAFAEQQTGI